ncbi:PREDICTED: uncharacterized protein LOC109161613 [Ipomoea nil]|uniref:uncharacterized protein LOC109161613 n=1 Tax=Ipomoea nil TaxID=35883 RepID=UPI000901150D|nr:PREDICTED: uncharacterized protein LOC109161613 [Ipomoea nil]
MESLSIDDTESRSAECHGSFFRDPSKLKEETVEDVYDSSSSEEIIIIPDSSPAKNMLQNEDNNKNLRKKRQVFLEGYVETSDDDEVGFGRTKSLTDDDLEELKGCLDLGFGFNYEEIPELCNTLPALELCYSMSQKYLLDDQHKTPPADSSISADSPSSASSPIANWKISSPGDDPEDVKARLKYWAQAVVCTVRLCSLQKKDE